MSEDKNLSRLFGGFLGEGFLGGGGLIILILAVVLLLGDDLLEFLFCEDNILIWVILIVLVLTNLDFDNGCGCC